MTIESVASTPALLNAAPISAWTALIAVGAAAAPIAVADSAGEGCANVPRVWTPVVASNAF